ncbi:MAG: right-handed parallel beta-helix repeat-containing protein, partial [Parabacteroides sp.]|nr:right-handed parallel beta-helix repeat-containing protein [Parabacteroides sp.]
GKDAIHIEGGKKHSVKGSLLEQFGCGGIRATGGDRKTLTPADFVIDNNIIQNFSLFSHTYQPAIFVKGVGMTIKNNHMRGSTSSAISVSANDVLIEYNNFSDLVRESDDQGGIDMYFDYSLRGLVIRYNYWENIVGGTSHGAAAIRFDDIISGEKIYGNVFVNCGSKRFGAVQIHGGKDNYTENNLFYKCNAAVSFSPWTRKYWNERLAMEVSKHRMYEAVDINSELYKTRYPELKNDLHADLNVNYVNNNLLVGCPRDIIHKSPKEEKLELQSIVKDNANIESADKELAYYLQDSVLKSHGLKPIPFSEIGPKNNKYQKIADR